MTPGQVMVPRQVTISEEVTTPGQMATSTSLFTSLLTRVPAPALLGKKVKGWTQVGSGAQLACPLALVMPSHQPTSRSSVGGGGIHPGPPTHPEARVDTSYCTEEETQSPEAEHRPSPDPGRRQHWDPEPLTVGLRVLLRYKFM